MESLTTEQKNILQEQISHKILTQLELNKKMTAEQLVDKIKTVTKQEIETRLSELGDLVKFTVGDTKTGGPQEFLLTEKGHDTLVELISFPEQFSPKKERIPKKKTFFIYWAGIFISTIIVTGFVIPFYAQAPIERTAFFLIIALLIEGMGFYFRLKEPSIKTNRVMYILLFGGFFGCWFSFFSIPVFDRSGIDDFEIVIPIWVGFFVLGGILGDLIGRARKYKGPQKYSF